MDVSVDEVQIGPSMFQFGLAPKATVFLLFQECFKKLRGSRPDRGADRRVRRYHPIDLAAGAVLPEVVNFETRIRPKPRWNVRFWTQNRLIAADSRNSTHGRTGVMELIASLIKFLRPIL